MTAMTRISLTFALLMRLNRQVLIPVVFDLINRCYVIKVNFFLLMKFSITIVFMIISVDITMYYLIRAVVYMIRRV
jgi:hypothetical protein